MSEEFVMGVGREALMTVLLVAAPILGLGLLAGLLVSVFQATTQINEQTLTFIPKILLVLVAILVFGPWMSNTLLTFTRDLYATIPDLMR